MSNKIMVCSFMRSFSYFPLYVHFVFYAYELHEYVSLYVLFWNLIIWVLGVHLMMTNLLKGSKVVVEYHESTPSNREILWKRDLKEWQSDIWGIYYFFGTFEIFRAMFHHWDIFWNETWFCDMFYIVAKQMWHGWHNSRP